MKARITMDELRRARDGCPDEEMDRIQREQKKDAWHEGEPDPRWGVRVLSACGTCFEFEVPFLTDDLEAALHAAVLDRGEVFDPRPVNVTGVTA